MEAFRVTSEEDRNHYLGVHLVDWQRQADAVPSVVVTDLGIDPSVFQETERRAAAEAGIALPESTAKRNGFMLRVWEDHTEQNR